MRLAIILAAWLFASSAFAQLAPPPPEKEIETGMVGLAMALRTVSYCPDLEMNGLGVGMVLGYTGKMRSDASPNGPYGAVIRSQLGSLDALHKSLGDDAFCKRMFMLMGPRDGKSLGHLIQLRD